MSLSWLPSGTTLLDFVLLLSPIVVVHEFGHLLVGKAFGVKATRFSVGFGPRLFGFQWGETEYRVSAIPLGGYVKFAGDNPLEEVAEADRGRGFLEQRPLKKALIGLAGPTANFLLALLILFGLALLPHVELTADVGAVKPGSPAALAGLKPGDRFVTIDGEPVSTFGGMQEKIEARPGRRLAVRVIRDGVERDLVVVPAVHEEQTPLETVRRGRIGISQTHRAAEIAVLGPETPAGRAGLQTFDLITRVGDTPVQDYEQLVRRLEQARGPVAIEALRRVEVPAPGGTLWTQRKIAVTLPLPAGPLPAELPVPTPDAASPFGLEAADLSAFAIQAGSAAEEAGLRRGDRLLTLQGRPVYLWADDVESIRAAAGAAPMSLVVRRNGRAVSLTVRQHLRPGRDAAGEEVQNPEFGALPEPNAFAQNSGRVEVRYGPLTAARHSLQMTGTLLRMQALMIASIVTGRVSSRNIGGMFTIGSAAREAAEQGRRMFLLVVAELSVSIGLFNLFPLPVLDGFHVLSAAIEGVRRRPLSTRFREIANVIGLAMVFSLMIFALRNDVLRMFAK